MEDTIVSPVVGHEPRWTPGQWEPQVVAAWPIEDLSPLRHITAVRRNEMWCTYAHQAPAVYATSVIRALEPTDVCRSFFLQMPVGLELFREFSCRTQKSAYSFWCWRAKVLDRKL